MCVAGAFLTFSSFPTDVERDQSAPIYSNPDYKPYIFHLQET